MVARKSRLILTALAAASALLVGVSNAAADGVPGAQKLEGAWIAKVPGTEAQWSYVIAADPSGRRAVGHGSVEVGFSVEAIAGPIDRGSPLLITYEMTGPETGVFSSIWYDIRDLAAPSAYTAEVVLIGVSKGTFVSVAPNKNVVQHNFEFCLPAQDGDGDGLPDAGQSPVYSMQVTSIDTRLPSP